MTTTGRVPFLDGGRPVAMAHRGGGAAEGENTARAFADAVALGFRYVETDVWATSDRQVVIFHDEMLDRVSDGSGAIRAATYEQLAQSRIGGTDTIPLLEDVLGSFPSLRLNVDLKCDEAVEPFVEVVRRTGAHDRVCVASFDDRRIRRAAALLGRRVCTSAGRSTVARLRLLSVATSRPLWLRNRPDVVQVPVTFGPVRIVTPTFVRRMHRWGIDVHCWTINDPQQMRDLLDLGVDGLISDATADLRAVLQQRGQWR